MYIIITVSASQRTCDSAAMARSKYVDMRAAPDADFYNTTLAIEMPLENRRVSQRSVNPYQQHNSRVNMLCCTSLPEA